MSDDTEKPDPGVNISAEMMQRIARDLGSSELDLRLARQPATSPPASSPYELVSPMTAAFNKLGDRGYALPQTLPFMGTSPVSYTSYRGNDGQMHMDGKRGIEYQVPDSNLRLLAGSYLPAQRTEGVEHWTAAVAWTPINLGGLKIGPMLGDVAQSDMREGAARPFDRVGLSVGLYAAAESKEGGLFARIETDPTQNNKLKAFVGFKMPFNGQ